jgi:hypothetical protein
MGDWGFGNFEDDDALDYVDGLTGRIAAELDRAAAKRRLSAHEVLTRCSPRLAVLAILARGVPMTGGFSPEQVGRWRDAFRAAFDRGSSDVYDDPADARRRWRAIERTFGLLSRSVAAGGA